MKYAVKIGSGAMKYILSFIKFCSGVQKLMGGGGGFRDSVVISQAHFNFFKMRKVG
jgi:hypothetical protein